MLSFNPTLLKQLISVEIFYSLPVSLIIHGRLWPLSVCPNLALRFFFKFVFSSGLPQHTLNLKDINTSSAISPFWPKLGPACSFGSHSWLLCGRDFFFALTLHPLYEFRHPWAFPGLQVVNFFWDFRCQWYDWGTVLSQLPISFFLPLFFLSHRSTKQGWTIWDPHLCRFTFSTWTASANRPRQSCGQCGARPQYPRERTIRCFG